VHLAGELEQVPAAGSNDVLPGDVEQAGELAEIGERPLVGKLPDDVVDDRLLAVSAVQVTIGEIVPLAYEREGLSSS
jgi:hypothetical protein